MYMNSASTSPKAPKVRCPQLPCWSLDGGPQRPAGDDDDASISSGSSDHCGAVQGISSADLPSSQHRSHRDSKARAIIIPPISTAIGTVTDPSELARELSDAAVPRPKQPQLPFQHVLDALPRVESVGEYDFSESDGRVPSWGMDRGPQRPAGDDDDASISSGSSDHCGAVQGISSADLPSSQHRSHRDSKTRTISGMSIGLFSSTQTVMLASSSELGLSDAATPQNKKPQLPFQGNGRAYAMPDKDGAASPPPHHHGSRWPLLWFAAGPLLGITLSTVSYGLWDMHSPFQWASWWRCALPCATVWLWLETSRLIVDYHYLLLLPRWPGPSHISRRQSVCMNGSLDLPSRSFFGLPSRAGSRTAPASPTASTSASPTASTPALDAAEPAEAAGPFRPRIAGCVALYLLGTAVMLFSWWAIAAAYGRYPFYFHGAIAATLAFCFVHVASLRLVLPRWVWRDARARRDARLVLLFHFAFILISIVAWGIMFLYSLALQRSRLLATATALLFPLLRGAGLFGAKHILSQVSTAGESGLALGQLMVNCNHVTFVVVALGESPWELALAITAMDLVMNLLMLPFLTGHMTRPWHYYVARPIRAVGHWVGSPLGGLDKRDVGWWRRIEALGLVSAELAEFVVPIAYGVIYLICRYGANGKWMAGVGANIWHYRAPDLGSFARNLAFMVGGDVVVGMTTHWLVRRYAKVDLLASSVRMARLYGPCIALTFAFLLYHQMCITVVHCGMDFTFSPRSSWPGSLTAIG